MLIVYDYVIEGHNVRTKNKISLRILEFDIDFEEMGKFKLRERAVRTGLFLEQAQKI
jgi:hypothetical protein